MAAFYYLLLGCLTGYFLMKYFLPSVYKMEGYCSLSGKPVNIPGWMINFPASFLIGTLALTWCVYIVAYLFRDTGKPLYYGNLLVILLFSLLSVILLIRQLVEKKELKLKAFAFNGRDILEYSFVLIIIAVSTFMMIYTFFVQRGNIIIGYSIFGDFGPHMAMIRSFSHGLNFPTEYPFFADGSIRYHFMFQFLAGNLEYLGLRLDWAFNIPSILSYTSFLMLLFSLAVVITGSKAAGFVTCILFFFRSSFAFFTYLKELIAEQLNFMQILSTILSNDEFIGKTPNEDWGLWNQNVFVNQRHFAFALGIMILIIIAVYPLFRDMLLKLAAGKKTVSTLLLDENAWRPHSFLRPVFIGILLGLLSFWNGAVVFATLPVLLILAIMSSHKLEYLIIALLTAGISYLETGFFIRNGASVVKPALKIGFIAADKSFAGILAYLTEMMGIFLFVIIAAVILKPLKGTKWLCLSFLTPLIFAFTVQLTPDITVNHKYVMISVILLNIIIADFIIRLYKIHIARIVAILLAMILTLTGFVDFITIYNRNNVNNANGKRPFTLRLDDPLTKWVEDKTKPNDIFLTDTYFIHPLLISGRKIFLGWHYFSWSAGYNTTDRENTAKRIFNADNEEELVQLVKQYKISYILIDDGLRASKVYLLNEQLISKTFASVYIDIDTGTIIYDCNAKER